jgi:hypothetical protein
MLADHISSSGQRRSVARPWSALIFLSDLKPKQAHVARQLSTAIIKFGWISPFKMPKLNSGNALTVSSRLGISGIRTLLLIRGGSAMSAPPA